MFRLKSSHHQGEKQGNTYMRIRSLCTDTVFARVICALFFSILAAEKSGCVKYADFFVGVLIWVLFQYN